MPLPKKNTTSSVTKNAVKQLRKSRTKGPLHPSKPEYKYKQLPISNFFIKFKNVNDNLDPQDTESDGKKSRKGSYEVCSFSNSKGNTTSDSNFMKGSSIPAALNNNNITTNGKLTKGKQSFKRNTSGSFDKYGIHLPNFEDVLEYQRILEHEKLLLDDLTHTMSVPLEALAINLIEPKRPEIVLGCEHLTEEEIDRSYTVNIKYIEDIVNGISYSRRHNEFKKTNVKDDYKTNDLIYNTSTITFTFEQKKLLLDRLRRQFGKEKLCKNDQYFFKVLLPEVCLKIFMDIHNMSKEDAIKYLDERPVDDII